MKNASAYFQQRRDRLRRVLKKNALAGLLVTKPHNVTYLTGFSGEDTYLLLWQDGEVLISDSRFTLQIEEECPGLDVMIRPSGVGLVKAAARAVRRAKLSCVGFEAGHLTVEVRESLDREFGKVEWVSTARWVEELRIVKDSEEIARIRKAAGQAMRAFAAVRASLRPDHDEKQLADLLEYQMRLLGARCAAFPTIVAVGPRAALPHAIPGTNRVEEHPILLIDWGADEGWYKSDLTRVLVTGKITPKFERLYELVLRAQEAGIAAIRPGATAAEVDAAARTVIEDGGFGRAFGHGLGHGVGLEIHEAPSLSAKSKAVLKPGMVVTVEPGVYLPGWGGIRIEDDVLVTRSGREVLTSTPKSLDDIYLSL